MGGGMVRDILVNQTPTALQADLNAVAALAAGVVVVTGHVPHYPSFAVVIVGAPMCFCHNHGHPVLLASANPRDTTTSTSLTRSPIGSRKGEDARRDGL
jgi:hypothetical protein